MEKMREGGFNLGGEQSGHIIFLDYTTTGDGMLSALQLVNIMKITGKPLSELANEMQTFPQQLVNVKVTDKSSVMANEHVTAIIEKAEKELGTNGRVLVRPSGTEPIVRVMVEAPTEEQCSEYVQEIAAVIQAEFGIETV